MTWGEFKAWAEERGVKDADEIEYVDFHGDPSEIKRVDDRRAFGVGWLMIT